jgi:hypothetical protein
MRWSGSDSQRLGSARASTRCWFPTDLSVIGSSEGRVCYQKCAIKVNVTIAQSACVHHTVDMVCGVLEDNPAILSTFMEGFEDSRGVINRFGTSCLDNACMAMRLSSDICNGR